MTSSSQELKLLLRHCFVRIVEPMIEWHNMTCCNSDATRQVLSPNSILFTLDAMQEAGVPLTPPILNARNVMKIERNDYSTVVDHFISIVSSIAKGNSAARLTEVRELAVTQWRQAMAGNDEDGDEYPYIVWDLFQHQLSSIFTEAVALVKLVKEDNSTTVETFLMSTLAECLDDLARRVQQHMASLRRCARNFQPLPTITALLSTDEEAIARRLSLVAGDELRDISGNVARDVVATLGEDLQDAIDRSNRKVARSSSRPSSSAGCSTSSSQRPPMGGVGGRPSSAMSHVSSFSRGSRTPQGASFRHLPPDPYRQQWIAKRSRTVEAFHAVAQSSVAVCEAVSEKLASVSQASIAAAGRKRGLKAALLAARDSQIDGLKAVRRALYKLEEAGTKAVLCADALGNEWAEHRRLEDLKAASQQVQSDMKSFSPQELSDVIVINPPVDEGATSHDVDTAEASASRPRQLRREDTSKPKAMPLPTVTFPLQPSGRAEPPARYNKRPTSPWDSHSASIVVQSTALSDSSRLRAAEAQALTVIAEQPRSSYPVRNGAESEAVGAVISQNLSRVARKVVCTASEERRLDQLRFGLGWRRSKGGVSITKPDTPLFESVEYVRLEKQVQAVSPGRIRRTIAQHGNEPSSGGGLDVHAEDELQRFLNPPWHQGTMRCSSKPS